MKLSTAILGTIIAALAASPASPGATEESGMPPQLKKFVSAKAQQIRSAAERLSIEVSPEVEDYLKAAQKGDWMEAMGMYDAVRNSRLNSDDPEQKRFEAISSAATLELQLAFEQIMETDPGLALKLGEAMMASVTKGAIYFGGDDPGRGLPTALSASHEKG